MDRDNKEVLVHMKDLDRDYKIIEASLTEELDFLKGIDLFPVNMFEYSRDVGKIEIKECFKELFIDGGTENTYTEPLVTALVEAKAKLETTLKTIDEEIDWDSREMDCTDTTLNNDTDSEETLEAGEPVLKEGKAFIAHSTSSASINLDSEITFVSENEEEVRNTVDSEDIVKSKSTVTMENTSNAKTPVETRGTLEVTQ